MPYKKNQPPKAARLDGASLVRVLLSYEDHWRLMLLLFVSGLLAGLVMYVYARPTYTSTSLIRVNQYVDSSQVAQGGGKDYLLMRTLLQQLSSGPMILEAARSLGMAGEKTTYNELRAASVPAVRIELLDQNNIEMEVSGFSPRVVRELPQALTDVYEQNKARLRNEYRDKAIKRYVDEIAVVRNKVAEQLDTRLKFEEESSLASAQIELERLSNVPVDLVRQRYRKEEMERVRTILEKQKASLGVVGQLALLTNLPKVSDDPLSSGSLVRQSSDPQSTPFSFQSPNTKSTYTQVVVQPDMVEGLEPWRDLEKKKRELEETMRLARAKYLDDHPEMIKLKEELRKVTSALDLELDVARKAFDLECARVAEKVVELESKLPAYHQATKTFDDKKLSYDLMKKGQLAWDKAYEQLSRQIELLQFGSDSGSINLEFCGFVNIRSEIPVSPSKSQLAMMGCLLGLGLAGGVPFLLGRLGSTVTSLNEFADSLGIPGIGIVPLSSPDVLEEINRSPTIGATTPNALLENFRLIRSSIILNKGPKGDARVIMVTSARPSEGKTTVAANIAWAFSSLGDRTLIIDCDLRRGRVHETTGCSNHPGMTDLLTGHATLEDCVQKSPADHLWLLPRGPVVPGTTELLNTPVFVKILEKLKSDYDRIILDTPPVLGLSETAFLQNHADGVVMVVKAGATPRKDTEDAFHTLGKLGAHFYGLVLNRVDFSKRTNHFNYYYYSSSYYESNWEDTALAGKALAPQV
ncbi:polysaccharide biosynthesis tyrosine autokinase [Prosthecobacter sp.]|uniref:polysaccharide biosynthesis tyrosine autokinase n=1 Tax=Prosthecobacter sp. TaxID=1965333 RepID=UPI003785192D